MGVRGWLGATPSLSSTWVGGVWVGPLCKECSKAMKGNLQGFQNLLWVLERMCWGLEHLGWGLEHLGWGLEHLC